MKKVKEIALDFEIDKLTNSIENIKTRDSFPTEITLLNKDDLISISSKSGWRFNW